MNWTFFLDALEIEEPGGFADIQLKIKRDDKWSGIFFEASTSDLQFYGEAARYLMNKKETEGFQADVRFRAVVDCTGDDEIFSGKLDFRQYKEKCGTICYVNIPVEQDSCIMTMRNRYDQKVDLSDSVAFDKLTPLPNYDGLNFGMTLAAQEISIGDEGNTGADAITTMISDDPAWVPEGGDDFIGHISVALTSITDSSFGTFSTSPDILLTTEGANNHPPYPDFPTTIGTAEITGQIQCELNSVTATFRHKGIVNIQQSGVGEVQFLRLRLWRLPAGLDPTVFANWVEEYVNEFYGENTDGPVPFDVSDSVSLTVAQGDFLWYGVFVINNGLSSIDSFEYTQDPESFFRLTAASLCEETTATVSLIHETASRIVEAITDNCLNVKSDYYGRTDSEPYQADEDGCGALRVLSSGLRIRNAENPKHFLSLKELYEGLTGIDNIGMGIEETKLRIEPVEYFYQDSQIIVHDSIPGGSSDMQPDDAFSVIKIGYKKWETENVNGLDEFNSNKEFRTSLKSISNTQDSTSGFIAGGYPIEHTREQSFAATGAADTKYDNDTFIICVVRASYAYGNYEVEQGNIDNAANIFSPATAYNWRIRPMYNLMRWWKSIAQSYVNLVNTASRLLFSAGTGNLQAEGELIDPYGCKIETTVKAENDDLTKSDMATGSDPLFKPETFSYQYPLSLKDYNIIKAAPYGYIYYQCGDGEFEKGFIKSIVYSIAKGQADITLIKKWDM